MNPSFSASHRLSLAALGLTNRLQEAARVRERLFILEPDFTVERFLATTPLDAGRIVISVREASCWQVCWNGMPIWR